MLSLQGFMGWLYKGDNSSVLFLIMDLQHHLLGVYLDSIHFVNITYMNLSLITQFEFVICFLERPK